MARYEIPIEVICDACGSRSAAKLARVEYAQAVEDRGAVQPIRGKAMKVVKQTREAVVLPDGWWSAAVKPPEVLRPPEKEVSCFAPAALVAQATGLSQEGYLCPKCADEAGFKKPEEVPAGVVPS